MTRLCAPEDTVFVAGSPAEISPRSVFVKNICFTEVVLHTLKFYSSRQNFT